MPLPSKTKRRCRLRNLDDSGQHFKYLVMNNYMNCILAKRLKKIF